VTKGELAELWADLPDDTEVAIEASEGYPMPIARVDRGLVNVGGGHIKHYLAFQIAGDEEIDDE
jgi:hypothetical protein